MEIVNNKALKLRLRKPEKVTEVIPKSQVIGRVGDVTEVLVHWGLEECMVLNNLGIKNIPSPIERDYPWHGLYKPFKHQRETAAFLTLHKRAYCFNEMGCVDSETEFLSPTGWVKISEYAGERVAQYHPDSREIEFVEPIEYIKEPCTDMIRFKTSRGVDQLLSPEHRMIIHDKVSKTGKWAVQSAEEMLLRYNNKIDGIYTPKSKSKVGIDHATIPAIYTYAWGSGLPDISLEALRVQVAVIADGHFQSKTNKCVVRLKRERKILRMRSILTDALIPYIERACPTGYQVFTFDAPTRDKKYTSDYWGCSKEQIDIIYDEVLHWDGSFSKGNRFASFSSTEKETIDFIQAVFNSKGHICSIYADHRDKYIDGVCYELSIRHADAGLLHLIGNRTEKISIRPEASIDGFKYCFSVPSTFLLFRRNGCVFASGNSGKSCSVLWAADYLMTKGLVNRVLVVCPLSIMNSAWRNDAFKSVMHRSVDVAHGSKDKRIKVINSGAEIVIINFDGVETVADTIANGGFDLIVIDEYNAYKNAQTARWKVMNNLVTGNVRLWGLTGSPASQSPLDAYGLAKLMNPSSVPKNFGAFRDTVMFKVTQFKYSPKAGANAYVHQVLQPAIRFTKEECLDLPDRTYVTREVPMTPQQERYYRKLKEEMLIQVAGEEISAANAAVNLGRLLQIASGTVYTDNKEVIEFDCSNRLKVLEEIIEESSKKVIVFAAYRHNIDMINSYLTKKGLTVDNINGKVPVSKRTEIFDKFQTTSDPKVLVIQPKSASHGVTLTAANTIVWWNPTMSYDTYIQSNDRIHRSGQDSPCTMIHLSGSPVETRIYKLLEQKSKMFTELMTIYKTPMQKDKKLSTSTALNNIEEHTGGNLSISVDLYKEILAL